MMEFPMAIFIAVIIACTIMQSLYIGHFISLIP